MRVLILGAGFGGLELSARLSEEFGEDLEIVLIDQSEGFVFGYSKLDVIFGRTTSSAAFHPYCDLDKPGLKFVRASILTIDPSTRTVETDAGAFDADILVVALGADLDPSATPGLVEGGNEFYTLDGAFALRDVLSSFSGGRVIVGVTSTPFKCPPAPSETALLLHDYLTDRGLRDESTISLIMPLGVPIPPSPAASKALLAAFEQRAIDWQPDRLVIGIDPARHVALLGDGAEQPFDLFLGVPVHRVPAVVGGSRLAVDGWIPVDSRTLETAFAGVYAIGDVTSVGTPKAGVFAEGQASVVADQIAYRLRGGSLPTGYDGQGTCYLEFGRDLVARVNVTFLSGAAPVGELEGPSQAIADDKIAFGTNRIRRWFDRDWTATPA